MSEMQVLYSNEFHWKETHMKLKSDRPGAFDSARQAVLHSRTLLEQYIAEHTEFLASLEPLDVDLNAPEFVREMMYAGLAAGVGPMAAVAGGLSEVATEAMIGSGCKCKLAMADNGGDVSIKGERSVNIGIYAGKNQVAKQVGFKIRYDNLPLGVCTSAGQVGHSISFGDAEAVIIFSRSAFLSDAAASAVANRVKQNDAEATVQAALEKAETIKGVQGCMVIVGDLVGTVGKMPEMIEIIDNDL